MVKFETKLSGVILLPNLVQVTESISGSVEPLAMLNMCLMPNPHPLPLWTMLKKMHFRRGRLPLCHWVKSASCTKCGEFCLGTWIQVCSICRISRKSRLDLFRRNRRMTKNSSNILLYIPNLRHLLSKSQNFIKSKEMVACGVSPVAKFYSTPERVCHSEHLSVDDTHWMTL